MKVSDAMLKGYAMVGRQCFGTYCVGDPAKPTAVCALGAARLALTGHVRVTTLRLRIASDEFENRTGFTISEANDKGMSIEDIAGILKSEGM